MKLELILRMMHFFFFFFFTNYEGYYYWLTNSMADFITIQYIRHRN